MAVSGCLVYFFTTYRQEGRISECPCNQLQNNAFAVTGYVNLPLLDEAGMQK